MNDFSTAAAAATAFLIFMITVFCSQLTTTRLSQCISFRSVQNAGFHSKALVFSACNFPTAMTTLSGFGFANAKKLKLFAKALFILLNLQQAKGTKSSRFYMLYR